MNHLKLYSCETFPAIFPKKALNKKSFEVPMPTPQSSIVYSELHARAYQRLYELPLRCLHMGALLLYKSNNYAKSVHLTLAAFWTAAPQGDHNRQNFLIREATRHPYMIQSRQDQVPANISLTLYAYNNYIMKCPLHSDVLRCCREALQEQV